MNYTRKPVNEEEIQEIVNTYKQGGMLRKMERETGISRYHLKNILMKHGVYTEEEVHKRNTRRKYDIDQTYFEEINTPNKAYVLGLLYADGFISIARNHKRKSRPTDFIGLALTESDKEILEKINVDLKYEKPLRIVDTKASSINGKKFINKKPTARLEITCVKMVNDLKKLGMSERKTATLLRPGEFLKENFYFDFIRGFIDGDGSLGFNLATRKLKKGGRSHSVSPFISIVGTKDMMNWIDEVFKRNIKDYTSTIVLDKRYSFDLYQIIIHKRETILQILEKLYDSPILYLERKYLTAHEIMEFVKDNNREEVKQKLIKRREEKIKNKHGQIKII